MKDLQEIQDSLNYHVLDTQKISRLSDVFKSDAFIFEIDYTRCILLALLDEVYELRTADTPDEIVAEAIDVLHFVMTLANMYHIDLDELDPKDIATDLQDSINQIYINASQISRETKHFKFWSTKDTSIDAVRADGDLRDEVCLKLNKLVSLINGICIINKSELVDEYMKKNKENIERQNSGY